MFEVHTREVEETRALGRALGRVAVPGTLLALTGGLGAGKTAFVQGIGEGLEVSGPVLSPTFVIIAEHEGRLPLLHADLYRVEPDELPGLGLEEALERCTGVAAVEWAERAPGLMPEDHLVLTMSVVEDGRLLRAEAVGPAHERLLRRWIAAVQHA